MYKSRLSLERPQQDSHDYLHMRSEWERKLKGYAGEHVKGYLSHGKIRSAQLPQASR